MKTFLGAAALCIFAGAASAQDCAAVTVEDRYDLDQAAITALYDCLKDKMAEGYAKEGHEIGTVFREWTITATAPALVGAHSNRPLLTFANDVAAEQYLKFEEEGVVMPVGSILAKESITISTKKKAARPGPLFTMEKVGLDKAPETMGWVYGGVQPNGKVMKVSQKFCHDCHVAFEDQDALGYPAYEVRIGVTN